MGIVSKIRKEGMLSSELVIVECNACGLILEKVRWRDYQRCVKPNGEYFCVKCASNGFKKWISFYEWCFMNMKKEEAEKLVSRWDFESNNEVSPNEVQYSTNKKYWFKCNNNCMEHHSELKSLNSFTNGKQKTINCSQCKSTTVASKRAKRIPFVCNDCGHEIKGGIYPYIKNPDKGFSSCPKCSDGISYPEKFLFSFLSQLGTKFKTQLSKADFNWCEKYRYDFYLEDFNVIVETHGLQHYRQSELRWGNLKDGENTDSVKKDLAVKNNINDYIILDCRESNINWIKKSILESNLINFPSFKIELINWDKCHKDACSTKIKAVCDLWNDGNTIGEIVNQMILSSYTVRRYLKKGTSINWCSYGK